MSRIGEDAQEWWDRLVANLAADGLELAPIGTTAERDELRAELDRRTDPPDAHPRLPNGRPVFIGDRLVFLDPDENVEVVVEVASLHYDHTDYHHTGEGPLGWVVTDVADDVYEYPLAEVLRVASPSDVTVGDLRAAARLIDGEAP